jgi:O-antigen biosynthesis protein
VCYGPFAPNALREPFAAPEQTAGDFRRIRELGANVLRIYAVPPRWFLDLAEEHQLKLLIDLSWNNHRCFLDSRAVRQQAQDAVREGVRACAAHPAVFAFSVANEVPPEIVRWSGTQSVADFIDELVDLAKSMDPDCLCTFGNFPPTEFLHPRHIDFICFNVYLHQRRPFENYLARLQMLADARPLVLGELGFDSLREGEQAKCEMLAWQIEAAFRGGLAGAMVYSFTDDWFTEGKQVEGWEMGLTTRAREPKPSFFAVQQAFAAVPYAPLERHPKVSVVVAAYNGGRTLEACLGSLVRLNYPDYEVLLVDDGSTDATAEIASRYKTVRTLRQANLGLSAARNTGIAAASGEIVAFTDADCRADEDWLYHLVHDLQRGEFTGIGGHNFLPAEDSPVAAAVLVSPGGPAHVMLTDRVAEHIPGCNMAFWKWALEEIGGFDPIFRRAGDDVDVCWRLQQRGYRIGFSPAGFVWHYRRSTVRAYLQQQRGYGEAEALLVRKHPEYFNAFGGSIWHGRIYTASKFGVVPRRPIIYHGVFGTGFFQTLYTAGPAFALMLCTSLEYHVLVALPLLVLSAPFPVLLPLAVAALLLSVGVCLASAAQAEIPRAQRRWWTRPLVAWLFFLQPIARAWARYQGRLKWQPAPGATVDRLKALGSLGGSLPGGELYYWAGRNLDRVDFLEALERQLDAEGWPHRADAGWSEHDLEILGNRWSRLQLTTVAEDYAADQRLFRCRLRSAWSLPATVGFWGTFAVELLFIGVAGRYMPWLWLVLVSMPALHWYLEREKRALRDLMAAFLDDFARRQRWVRLKFDADKNSFAPA